MTTAPPADASWAAALAERLDADLGHLAAVVTDVLVADYRTPDVAIARARFEVTRAAVRYHLVAYHHASTAIAIEEGLTRTRLEALPSDFEELSRDGRERESASNEDLRTLDGLRRSLDADVLTEIVASVGDRGDYTLYLLHPLLDRGVLAAPVGPAVVRTGVTLLRALVDGASVEWAVRHALPSRIAS